ncbi:DUF4954 family protein, partial [Candidatus Sumerlaeota bacterium]|nr:DUF4954 family protein [Candidatus Sumerlaeota bacterium]
LRKRPKPSLLYGDKVKPLTSEQVARLQVQGCDASDWSRIYAVEGFNWSAVQRTRFQGTCVLGSFRETHDIAPGVRVPSGIYNAMLVNCEVGSNCLIRDVGLLANYVIAEGAAICSVCEMRASGQSAFGNSVEIVVGPETGERAICAFAELDLPLASQLALAPAESQVRVAYNNLLSRYLENIALDHGYVGPKASVRACRRLCDVWIGEGAVVEGATAITNSTILSSRDEPTHIGDGAEIHDSLIQWGCAVASGALVEKSLLTEHSHAERHAKVQHSILGPNTSVGEGEITSALLGPFVAAHHESLIIAAIWPDGKGNLGYGANVGSNHTSKAPDQEIWPGEGMFFGLGVNIKFPGNFEAAPYSIIASGVTTLPQKVEFPFSLINSPSRVFEGVSPAFNEIVPGWAISNNLYALVRNETKYADRNRARRTPIRTEVFRPDIIGLVREARDRLAKAPQKSPARPDEPVLYFEKDIPGLGKNYLLESNRTRAIEAYSFVMRFYALRGFYRHLMKAGVDDGRFRQIEERLHELTEMAESAHAMRTLRQELPGKAVRELLEIWIEHHRQLVESICSSKARDDERGARIITDYAAFHRPAAEDKVVRNLVAQQEEIEKRIKAWFAQ